jgi:hypothetical protein
LSMASTPSPTRGVTFTRTSSANTNLLARPTSAARGRPVGGGGDLAGPRRTRTGGDGSLRLPPIQHGTSGEAKAAASSPGPAARTQAGAPSQAASGGPSHPASPSSTRRRPEHDGRAPAAAGASATARSPGSERGSSVAPDEGALILDMSPAGGVSESGLSPWSHAPTDSGKPPEQWPPPLHVPFEESVVSAAAVPVRNLRGGGKTWPQLCAFAWVLSDFLQTVPRRSAEAMPRLDVPGMASSPLCSHSVLVLPFGDVPVQQTAGGADSGAGGTAHDDVHRTCVACVSFFVKDLPEMSNVHSPPWHTVMSR